MYASSVPFCNSSLVEQDARDVRDGIASPAAVSKTAARNASTTSWKQGNHSHHHHLRRMFAMSVGQEYGSSSRGSPAITGTRRNTVNYSLCCRTESIRSNSTSSSPETASARQRCSVRRPRDAAASLSPFPRSPGAPAGGKERKGERASRATFGSGGVNTAGLEGSSICDAPTGMGGGNDGDNGAQEAASIDEDSSNASEVSEVVEVAFLTAYGPANGEAELNHASSDGGEPVTQSASHRRRRLHRGDDDVGNRLAGVSYDGERCQDRGNSDDDNEATSECNANRPEDSFGCLTNAPALPPATRESRSNEASTCDRELHRAKKGKDTTDTVGNVVDGHESDGVATALLSLVPAQRQPPHRAGASVGAMANNGKQLSLGPSTFGAAAATAEGGPAPRSHSGGQVGVSATNAMRTPTASSTTSSPSVTPSQARATALSSCRGGAVASKASESARSSSDSRLSNPPRRAQQQSTPRSGSLTSGNGGPRRGGGEERDPSDAVSVERRSHENDRTTGGRSAPQPQQRPPVDGASMPRSPMNDSLTADYLCADGKFDEDEQLEVAFPRIDDDDDSNDEAAVGVPPLPSSIAPPGLAQGPGSHCLKQPQPLAHNGLPPQHGGCLAKNLHCLLGAHGATAAASGPFGARRFRFSSRPSPTATAGAGRQQALGSQEEGKSPTAGTTMTDGELDSGPPSRVSSLFHSTSIPLSSDSAGHSGHRSSDCGSRGGSKSTLPLACAKAGVAGPTPATAAPAPAPLTAVTPPALAGAGRHFGLDKPSDHRCTRGAAAMCARQPHFALLASSSSSSRGTSRAPDAARSESGGSLRVASLSYTNEAPREQQPTTPSKGARGCGVSGAEALSQHRGTNRGPAMHAGGPPPHATASKETLASETLLSDHCSSPGRSGSSVPSEADPHASIKRQPASIIDTSKLFAVGCEPIQSLKHKDTTTPPPLPSPRQKGQDPKREHVSSVGPSGEDVADTAVFAPLLTSPSAAREAYPAGPDGGRVGALHGSAPPSVLDDPFNREHFFMRALPEFMRRLPRGKLLRGPGFSMTAWAALLLRKKQQASQHPPLRFPEVPSTQGVSRAAGVDRQATGHGGSEETDCSPERQPPPRPHSAPFPRLTEAEVQARTAYNRLHRHGGRPTNGECLIVVRKVVYDVSSFLLYHPGGAQVILDCEGKEATAVFESFHPWISCENMLGPFAVGILDREERGTAM